MAASRAVATIELPSGIGVESAGRPALVASGAGDVVPSLVVQNLQRSFGRWQALAGVSFEAGPGVIGLLGPNGAGKSTLLRCLAGISGWDLGRIAINGIDIDGKARAARSLVGFMPERVAFPAEMRVEGYLRFVAAAKGVPRPERTDAVERALSRSGLDGARARILGNMSKGYRQRVGLAQAIIDEPPVVILDEPTAGMDPVNVVEVREALSAYASGRVVLLSTHSLAEARLLCDRVVVLGAGSVVYDGPTAELASAGAREVRIRFRGAGPGVLGALVADVGAVVARTATHADHHEAVVVLTEEDALGPLARALVLGGLTLLALEPTSDVLEEAFRRAVLRTAHPRDGMREKS